jgi:hypothetical protein
MATAGTDTLDTASLQALLTSQLTEEQARLIYAQVAEAVVFALLSLAKQLAEKQVVVSTTPTPAAGSRAGWGCFMTTPDQRALIRSLVERWLASPVRSDLINAVRVSGALPVYSDMGGTLLLRPDGEILSLGSDSEDGEPQVETDFGWRITAVVVGAEQYPELRPLLPIRPSGTEDCKACAGVGRVRIGGTDRHILCGRRHGLGWLAAAP